jgi:hypothetical protein
LRGILGAVKDHEAVPGRGAHHLREHICGHEKNCCDRAVVP